MGKGKVSSGMWRIDPKKRSRVIDRCGQPVASAEAENDASLIASAPDMFDLLESLEHEESQISSIALEEIRLVLRRARGDFGFAVFSNTFSRQRRRGNQDWLKFMEGLLDDASDDAE